MATYDSAIPGADQYLMASAVAKLAYQNAVTQIQQNRQGILSQAGYQANFDPTTGAMSGLHVDPNNPYGTYQSERRSHAQAAESENDMLSERGIHGGLANQDLANQKYDFGREDNQLGQSLLGSIGDLAGQQTHAKYDYDMALYQAQLQQAQAAIDARNFNPADQSGTPVAQYGADATPSGPTQDPGSDYPSPNDPYTDPPPYQDPAGTTSPTQPYNQPISTSITRTPAPIYTHEELVQQRDAQVRRLVSAGLSVSGWAALHPAEASRLGISSVQGGNLALINQVMGR